GAAADRGGPEEAQRREGGPGREAVRAPAGRQAPARQRRGGEGHAERGERQSCGQRGVVHSLLEEDREREQHAAEEREEPQVDEEPHVEGAVAEQPEGQERVAALLTEPPLPPQ